MPTSIRIHTHDGRRLELAPAPGLTLAQSIFLAGLWEGVPLCAGMGRCGLCRARFVSPAPPPTAEEAKRLGGEALAQGWRLTCLSPSAPCEIELPEPRRAARKAAAKERPKALRPLELAVDLGTTSIHWAALSEGRVLEAGQGLNPQMGLGSEVMSRLAFAQKPGGAEILRKLATERLRKLAEGAEADLGAPVSRLCVAGNPAMTCLLLGLPVSGLAAAPYKLPYAGGAIRPLAPGLPEAMIPPLLSPFVGADLSAGLAALQFSGSAPAYPFLLADLGTNGEFVLALSPTERLLASVPMGPSLEGVGLRHGGTAAPGAVQGFELTPAGLAPAFVEHAPEPGAPPVVTGVGYLSLIAALARAGVLDEHGRFREPATPLGRRLARGLADLSGESALDLGHGLLLPASDVEELIKVKAAFNLALSRLFAESGLSPAALTAVHLAGAMGEHVDAGDLAALGFLPETLARRLVRAGNTSLAGAGVLLTNPAAWDWTLALPGTCRALDLAAEHDFGAQFVERMVLRHVA